jgi:hypothetical protein
MLQVELGTHTLTQDGEQLRLWFHGPLTLPQAQQLRARIEELTRVGRCFMLVDMSELTTMEPDARRFLSDWGRASDMHISGAALFGTSFAMRAMTTLILSAIRVLGQREIHVVFVRDEAEARAWLAERTRSAGP